MAYEKTNWSSGDVITAEKLNKLEGGIVDSEKIETVTWTIPESQTGVFTSDKTYAELDDIFTNGKSIMAIVKSSDGQVIDSGILCKSLSGFAPNAPLGFHLDCLTFVNSDVSTIVQVQTTIYWYLPNDEGTYSSKNIFSDN